MWYLGMTALAALPYAPGAPFFQQEGTNREALRSVAQRLDGHHRPLTVWWRDGGQKRQVWPKKGSDTKLGRLPAPLGHALDYALSVRFDLEGERDLILRNDRGHPVPVTLWFDPDGITVARGSAAPSLTGPVSTTQLERDFGLRFLSEDRTYTADILRAFQRALTLLGPREREALRGLEVMRKAADPHLLNAVHIRSERTWIDYVEHEYVGRVEIYDDIPTRARWFVGPVASPEHPLTYAVLHQLGHAIAGAERRKLAVELHRGRDAHRERHRELTTWYEAFDAKEREEHGPAIEQERMELAAALEAQERDAAWLDRLLDEVARTPPRPAMALREACPEDGSPTEVGRNDPIEAYADALALYHLDPDALRRAAPCAHAWFTDGA